MPFILKINMRSSDTGSAVRVMRGLNNLTFTKQFNSLASTFSFDFKFDPKNKEHAEMICLTHMHECQLYYTTNTDPNYLPKADELELTGLMMYTKLTHAEEPDWVRISGYSKPGTLNDSDWPTNVSSEMEGLSLYDIIKKVIREFNLKLVVGDKAKGEAPAKFDDREEIGKTSADSQNIGSYLTGLAKQRNIVISHTAQGDLLLKKPNTKGKPILVFDFTDKSSDAGKIPGVVGEIEYNGQVMHSHITVKQDASDDEDSNGVQTEPLRNPLLPTKAVYRPKIYSLSSGSEFSAEEYAKYEMGREIREGVKLTIYCPLVQKGGKLISPDNIVTVRDPRLFLYNLSNWYIESISFRSGDEGESCTLNCVLPYCYDFDESTLKNVFVDAHQNLPLF